MKHGRSARVQHGNNAMTTEPKFDRKPGEVIPWREKVKELPELSGNPDLVKKTWEDADALAYVYIWQLLLSF